MLSGPHQVDHGVSVTPVNGPVIAEGAQAMDDIFAEDREGEEAGDSEEGGAVARSNLVGPLFGPPGMKKATSQIWEVASHQRRGGGI